MSLKSSRYIGNDYFYPQIILLLNECDLYFEPQLKEMFFMSMKNFKNIFYIIRFLLFCLVISMHVNTDAQNPVKYGFTCSDEELYYKQFNPSSLFQSKAMKEITPFFPAHCTMELSDTLNPYYSIVALSKYEKQFDVLLRAKETEYRLNKMSKEAYFNCLDSLIQLYGNTKLGPVLKKNIINADTNGRTCAILFKSNGPEVDKENIWIAISNNKGKDWRKYYLGITQNNFFHIKAIQNKRLLPKSSMVQIEAALINVVKETKLVSDTPVYSLLKDNILLSFPIKEITKDSDEDGYTDLYENKISTNIENQDSDHDNIRDSIDKNPRYQNLGNDFAKLGMYLFEKIQKLINPDSDPYALVSEGLEDRPVYFLIIDDPRLRNISPENACFVVFSKEEYINYLTTHPKPSGLLFFTPLFSVDKQPNFYKINIIGSTLVISYLIKWDESGWYIKLLEDK